MAREAGGYGAGWPRSLARPWAGTQETAHAQPPEVHGRRHAAWVPPEVPDRPGTRDSGLADGTAAVAGDPGEYGPREGGSEDLWAMLSYLGAIFLWLLIPLAIYLAKRKTSRYVRCHAAQALNLVITTTLFGVACVIVGGLLALDTAAAALAVMIPLACALWLVMLTYLLRAVLAASRGDFCEIPAWLCAPIIR